MSVRTAYQEQIGQVVTYTLDNMSKEMTGREKLIFLLSFFWAMHWGVRLTFAAFSTLEMRYF